MNCKTLIRKALSLCLIVAVYASYSMVALAGSKVSGELVVSGKSANVLVNGQEAQSGRTIFTASTITTPETSSAIVSVGKLGKIEVAPNSTVTLNFDDNGISGNLANGTVTVLGAKESVNFITPEGSKSVPAGKSVTTGKSKDDDDDDDDDKGAAWWLWAAIFGGAIAGVVIAATSDNNRVSLGGGGTVLSPSR